MRKFSRIGGLSQISPPKSHRKSSLRRDLSLLITRRISGWFAQRNSSERGPKYPLVLVSEIGCLVSILAIPSRDFRNRAPSGPMSTVRRRNTPLRWMPGWVWRSRRRKSESPDPARIEILAMSRLGWGLLPKRYSLPIPSFDSFSSSFVLHLTKRWSISARRTVAWVLFSIGTGRGCDLWGSSSLRSEWRKVVVH